MFGCSLAFRERTDAVTQVGKAFLEMHRDWIVDFRANPLPLQGSLQLIALGDAYHKLIEDVPIVMTWANDPRPTVLTN